MRGVITLKDMNEIELQLNRIAQGTISIENGASWFEYSNQDDRRKIMQCLDLFIQQSHPTNKEIEAGISLSGLKETFAPCVIVRNRPFYEARQKILQLQNIDKERAFQLFVSIFKVADTRRRETECKNGCSHEWHNLERL